MKDKIKQSKLEIEEGQTKASKRGSEPVIPEIKYGAGAYN